MSASIKIILEEPINGNRVTRDEINYMPKEYYPLRGWDEDGKPLKEISLK